MKPQQHWAHMNEFSFIAGMRFLFWVYRWLGRGPFRIVLYPVLIGYLITKPAARAASRNYLQHLHHYNPSLNLNPNLVNIWRHFTAFADSILDKMLLWGGLFKLDNIHYEGQGPILKQMAQGQGGLFICAHLGNLELCRLAAKRCPGLKMTALIHTKHAQAFNQLLAQLHPDSQLNLIQVTEITPAVAMQLMDKIAQGEFIAIAGDRIPVTLGPRVAFAPFLGESAPFPVGPYVLASLLQCPVYLMFSVRTPAGASLYFEPFRDLIQLPRKNRDALLAELAADYAARLEYYCLQTPLQWFNFYDFWRLPKRDTPHETH